MNLENLKTMERNVTTRLCLYLCLCPLVVAHMRTKRIAGGRDLPDHKLYDTQFVVSLHATYRCASEQFNHLLEDCVNEHFCGGSLISTDFVLTACHCLTIETWYGVLWPKPRPPIRKIGPGDIPPYIDDRVHVKRREEGDPAIYRTQVIVKHPLFSDITIFAGNARRTESPQRRHSAKNFVHHLCADRSKKKYPELWEDEYYELDIGLVKTCYPFKLNSAVNLAPLRPWKRMDEHLQRLMDISATCLLVGWGLALVDKPGVNEGYQLYSPNTLQHMFRYIQCNRDCTSDKHNCVICTRHHGPRMAITRKGDSGSPLICDGLLTAVHSRGLESKATDWIEKNFTLGLHIAVTCVKDFISPEHLSYLRTFTHEPFHYINGKPVDGTFP